jgi:tetratricopeptide (TPR) repeat protein
MRVRRAVYLAIAVAALIATYIEHRLALEAVIARCDTNGGARTVSACTELIRRDPIDRVAYYNLGNGYQDVDDRALAIADYTKAIEINPFYAAAYNSRGYTYLTNGDHDKAIAEFSKAIEIDPEYALAYNNRAWVYAQIGRPAEGLPDIENSLLL